jgi:hypothetical protein
MEIDSEEKDFDVMMEDATKITSVEEVDVDSCPYTLYHLDIGGAQSVCRAHTFKPSLEITKDKQEIVGLHKKETKMGALQRAMTLLNRTLKILITVGITQTQQRKNPLKIVPMDHNTTYEKSVMEAANIYVKTISELFTNNYNGPLKVTPLSQKELDNNKKIILILSRKENFKNKDQATKLRTTLYLPAYVLLLHAISDPQYQSVLDTEAGAYGKQYAQEVYKNMLEIMAATQFKHYCKRLKIISGISQNYNEKFRNAMCDFNYYAIK